MAKQVRLQGRSDVCALPFGINIITLIAFVFLVLYPAKFIGEAQGLTGDDVAIFAWRAGILACFVSGLIEFFGSFVAESIRRFTPRAALLAPVGGIGLCFLSMDFSFVPTPLRFSGSSHSVSHFCSILDGFASRVGSLPA
ncbi:hypothetical protein IG197_35860 (plasmid) [Aminobacter sp. SR38]|uniref:hypothetical protein n=1 Tax=Aminobacter sp. SR38 TaxID=2774562 RepID=UPI00178300BC|nr:hypothetical protein [Aminobacter sp. SR38]QOF75870.1 hypothetical protein IG197_35860 [Aminobacter sp. SR38]